MIGSVAWLKKARAAVDDMQHGVSAALIVSVIALVLSLTAVGLVLIRGRKQV